MVGEGVRVAVGVSVLVGVAVQFAAIDVEASAVRVDRTCGEGPQAVVNRRIRGRIKMGFTRCPIS